MRHTECCSLHAPFLSNVQGLSTCLRPEITDTATALLCAPTDSRGADTVTFGRGKKPPGKICILISTHMAQNHHGQTG